MKLEIEPQAGSAYTSMLQALEAIGEAGIDIVPPFFERLFGAFPDEERNFHNPLSSKGAMVNEMIGMLLAQAAGEPWVEQMIRSEVLTHHTYGDIALQRYRDGLDCLVEVLRDAAGESWLPQHEAAWRGEADRLYAMIARFY